MTAQIVMDAGAGPVAGSLVLPGSGVNTAVTLTNFNNTGVLGWKWEIVDAPLESPTLYPLPAPTYTNTKVVTPDVKGHAILIRLTTYTDAPRTILDAVDQKILGVRFDPPRDWLIPAAGESTELDIARGWATEVNRMLDELNDASHFTILEAPVDGVVVEDGQQMLYIGTPSGVFTGELVEIPDAVAAVQTVCGNNQLIGRLNGDPLDGYGRTAVRSFLELPREELVWNASSEPDGTFTGSDQIFENAFTAQWNVINKWSGLVGAQADLPDATAADHNRVIAFYEQVYSNTNPLNIIAIGSHLIDAGAELGQASIYVHGAGSFVVLRYDASTTNWQFLSARDTAYLFGKAGSAFENRIIVTDENGAAGSIQVGLKQIVGRSTDQYLGSGLQALQGPQAQQAIACFSAIGAGPTIEYVIGSQGEVVTVTLDQVGHTFDFQGLEAGQRGLVIVKQDGTGSRTITTYECEGDSAAVKFPGGVAPVLSAGIDEIDTLEWFYDGTDLYIRLHGTDWS